MKSIPCLVLLLLTSACCSRPASHADEVSTSKATTAAPQSVEPPAPEPSQTTEPAAPVAGVVNHKGLAASLCPSGPFPTPLNGEVQATVIPNSDPGVLDPKDTGFHLYEGPVWLDGVLYFSDFVTTAGFPSRIMSYTPDKGISVAAADAGTNGLGLDATGTQLVGARHKSKSVVKFSKDLRDSEDVVSDYLGKAFNSPNDLAFRSDGNLYFTDPDFQAGEQREQATTNVYRVSPAGNVSVVDDSIANPNGISISPDESSLYVAGNLEEGYVKKYPITGGGSVGVGEIVLSPVSVPDGMVFDCAGNLYVTEHTNRRIRVLGADGKELGQITGLPKNVTNVAFGGPQHKTLYITLTGALAKIDLPVPGLPY